MNARSRSQQPKTQTPTTLTFRVISIFSAVISRIIAKLSLTSIRQFQIDPDYALAYAGRSEAWTLIGDLTGEVKTAWAKARSDAEKAVAIAPRLAEAHAALGWVRLFTEWRFDEGLRELKRAKELSPANPTANDLLARVIVYLGRVDEAERQARQAVELDPLSYLPQNNLARVLFIEGNWMRPMRSRAKRQSYNPRLPPIIGGRYWSRCSAVMVRGRSGKRNWNPTRVLVVSSSPSPNLCAAIVRQQTPP